IAHPPPPPMKEADPGAAGSAEVTALLFCCCPGEHSRRDRSRPLLPRLFSCHRFPRWRFGSAVLRRCSSSLWLKNSQAAEGQTRYHLNLIQMSRFLPERGRVDPHTLPRGPNGRALCRRCGTEVSGRRRTFCSDSCVHEWKLRTQGDYLREQVFQRDRG